jgi:hypothetical protein
MISPLPIDHRYDTRDSRWLAARRAQARIGPLRSLSVATPIVSPTIRVAFALPRAHPTAAVSRPWQPPTSANLKQHAPGKSP